MARARAGRVGRSGMTVVVRVVRVVGRHDGQRLCGRPGGIMAATAAPATAQALKRLASGSDCPATGSPPAARSPAGPAFSGRTTLDTRPPDRDDAGHDLFRQPAAVTCPRRRNAHLPGTIRQSLQITAVRGLHLTGVGWPCGPSSWGLALPEVNGRVPGVVRHRCGLPGLPGVASLARRVRLRAVRPLRWLADE